MATRTALNKAYFEHMHNAKIIVTVNPADWEGDFRTWEALAAGALVFVDPLMVPYPFPLLDGIHIVYYSIHNKTELWQKLDYYINNPVARERVAINGYLYAMKHHRTANLIDYVLRTAETKKYLLTYDNHTSTALTDASAVNYTYTGQYLNYEARRQENRMKNDQKPGHYIATTSTLQSLSMQAVVDTSRPNNIKQSKHTNKPISIVEEFDVELYAKQNIPSNKNNKNNITLSIVSNNSSVLTNVKFKKLKETITKHAKPHEMINPDKMTVQVVRDHHYSPRQGTQITQLSLQKQTQLLSCDNQASCIIPALQLQKQLNIYLCQKPKNGGGVRFYFLIKQGLLQHPNVILLEQLNNTSILTVDYIFYLPGSSPWDTSECGGELTHNYSKHKMIVLEEYDGLEPLFSPYKTYDQMVKIYGKDLLYSFMYFKRSFAHRHSGTFIDFPLISKKSTSVRYRDVYPITYPIADDYISTKYNFHNHREIEILCTLRGSRNASSPMITRIRAQEWVTEYVHSRNISHAITEPVSAPLVHIFVS